MQLSSFPSCCTTVILHDLHPRKVNADYYRDSREVWEKAYREAIKEEINSKLRTEGGYDDYSYDRLRKLAYMIAITSNDQRIIEEALRDFGFQCTRSATSARHDTTTRIWWLRIQDWCEKNSIDPHEYEEREYDDEEEDY